MASAADFLVHVVDASDPAFREQHAVTEQVLGGASLEHALALQALATTLARTGRFEEAERKKEEEAARKAQAERELFLGQPAGDAGQVEHRGRRRLGRGAQHVGVGEVAAQPAQARRVGLGVRQIGRAHV